LQQGCRLNVVCNLFPAELDEHEKCEDEFCSESFATFPHCFFVICLRQCCAFVVFGRHENVCLCVCVCVCVSVCLSVSVCLHGLQWDGHAGFNSRSGPWQHGVTPVRPAACHVVCVFICVLCVFHFRSIVINAFVVLVSTLSRCVVA
jgi:hypothetical protein